MTGSELDFLLDLLFDHKLPDEAVTLIRERVREIQKVVPRETIQAPRLPPEQASSLPPPGIRVAQIAQTPATMAAMASRQAAIEDSLNGRTNKETGRPRKF